MSKEVTGGMGADEARLAVLEQKAVTQGKQIAELFKRMKDVETEQSAQGATQEAMQKSIVRIESNTDTTVNKLDALKMWMMAASLTALTTAVFLLVQWAR